MEVQQLKDIFSIDCTKPQAWLNILSGDKQCVSVGEHNKRQCQSGVYCMYVCTYMTVFVGPCHHGMACPQVADGGTASDLEGSCE